MMHSCGSVYPVYPRLIDLGLDILDVIQVQAADMAIDRLAKEFGKGLAFCGGHVFTELLTLWYCR